MTGTELPAGWRLDDNTLRTKIEMGPWVIDVEADLGAPFTGPSSIKIEFEGGETPGEGVTLEVLRSIPLGQIRRDLSEALPRLRAAAGGHGSGVPSRVETDRDLALCAQEYIRLLSEGDQKPIQTLAAVTGTSRNTWSARIRRARNIGLIIQTGKGTGHLSAQLTSKARDLLEQDQ